MNKETRPQDIPAVCEYSGLPAVEHYNDSHSIDYKAITKLIDDLNVIDTTDEIDKKEETKKEDRDFMYKWIREKSGK